MSYMCGLVRRQCRSYIRLQRLARGRVMFTLKDRARKEMSGDDMKPDYFKGYMTSIAGWSVGE